VRRLHVSRLAESLQLLQEGGGGEGDALASADAVQRAVWPTVRAALRGAQQAQPCTVGGAPRELLLTVHVKLAAEGAAESRVTAHACALPAPRTSAVAAAVLGPPRTTPRAKASTWVAQRAPLEAARPADCGETVLSCADSGALLEGLVSNLFVVSLAPDGIVELRTASLRDGVLGGVARAAILRAAEALPGLRVCEEAPVPPPPGDEAAWTEAFTCNAARGVTPLHELRWLPPLGSPSGAEPPRPPLRFTTAPGPVTAALAAALQEGLHAALSPDCTD
jgi:branched-subunit amino acid aminotransferase/4-amino-4-deoxychorismate lyase